MTCPFCGAECVPSVIADWRCERCENWYDEEEEQDEGGEAVAPLIEDMIRRIELIAERTERQVTSGTRSSPALSCCAASGDWCRPHYSGGPASPRVSS